MDFFLDLMHTNVTRAAEEEAKESEVLEVVGRQVEEAVDSIVQAAVEGLQFPETSYETLHSQPGGIDLLIGTRAGKGSFQFNS